MLERLDDISIDNTYEKIRNKKIKVIEKVVHLELMDLFSRNKLYDLTENACNWGIEKKIENCVTIHFFLCLSNWIT